jgi:hypothetical protein
MDLDTLRILVSGSITKIEVENVYEKANRELNSETQQT